MNHYSVLNVTEYSSLDEIKDSFKTLSKKYHPNSMNPESSSEKFIMLKSSYDFLVKNHRQKVNHNVKFEGDIFYRILNPKDDIAEIYFTLDIFDKPSRIYLMKDMKEFTITLKAGTKIPITLQLINLGEPLTLRIKKGYNNEV